MSYLYLRYAIFMSLYFYDQSPYIAQPNRKNTAVVDGKPGIFECRYGILRNMIFLV